MRVFKVVETVFKTEPLFVFDCTAKELQDYILEKFKFHQEVDQSAVATMFTFDRNPWRLVWVRSEKLPEIAHEVFHLVTRICYDRGIRIVSHDESRHLGDETGAYLMEFFMDAVVKRLRKHRKH